MEKTCKDQSNTKEPTNRYLESGIIRGGEKVLLSLKEKVHFASDGQNLLSGEPVAAEQNISIEARFVPACWR